MWIATEKSKQLLGVVYLIETETKNNVKVGFTTNFKRRLSEFRTCSPLIKPLGVWVACHWYEEWAINVLKNKSIEQVYCEVFRVKDAHKALSEVNEEIESLYDSFWFQCRLDINYDLTLSEWLHGMRKRNKDILNKYIM